VIVKDNYFGGGNYLEVYTSVPNNVLAPIEEGTCNQKNGRKENQHVGLTSLSTDTSQPIMLTTWNSTNCTSMRWIKLLFNFIWLWCTIQSQD
jgi:hypothetical protein